jgi:hypothetical protein
MLRNKVAEENQPAPAITQDMLPHLKDQDMQQAVIEKFRKPAKSKRVKTDASGD